MTITRAVSVSIGVRPGATPEQIAAAMAARLAEHAKPEPGEEIATATIVVEFRRNG